MINIYLYWYKSDNGGEMCPGAQNSPTEITKTAKIRKGTKKQLKKALEVGWAPRELRILWKVQELRKLRKFAKISEGPTRITKTAIIRKGTKNALQDARRA